MRVQLGFFDLLQLQSCGGLDKSSVYTQLAHAAERAPKAKRRQSVYLPFIFYKSSISKKSPHRLIITEGPEEDGGNGGGALREHR